MTNLKDRRLFINITLLFAVAIGLGIVINRIRWQPLNEPLLEGIGLYLMTVIIFSNHSVRNYFHRLPKPHCRIIVIFFALMIFAHLANIYRTTYPFHAWRMFSQKVKPPKVIIFKYIGITDRGEEIELNPSRLFSSVTQGGIVTAYDYKMLALLHPDVKEEAYLKKEMLDDQAAGFSKNIIIAIRKVIRDKPKKDFKGNAKEFNELLFSLGKMHNLLNPDKTISVIKTRKYEFDIRKKKRQFPEGVFVWEFNLPKGMVQ